MTTDVEKQEGQKTVVSFAAGLLIGGLLVWAFSGSPETDEARTIDAQNNDETTEMTEDTEATEDESENAVDTGATSEDTTADMSTDTVETPTMEIGDASVELGDLSAGSAIMLEGATFPTNEGWVGVRTYTNDQVGSILGVSRYSNEQGLIPSQIDFLVPTVAGQEYAVVFFNEDGDRNFNPAADAQLEGVVTTFTAQ